MSGTELLTAPQPLWTIEEVAAYLNISRAHAYTLPIRFSKIGKSRRYDPADVRLYVQLNSTGRLRTA